MTRRKIFFDTEFLDDGKTIELISIGMVDDQGAEYYAVNAEMDTARIAKHKWLMHNVVRYLPIGPISKISIDESKMGGTEDMVLYVDKTDSCVKTRKQIAQEVYEFILGDVTQVVDLWAWFAAYDHVALAQLWGPMITMPCPPVPMQTDDLVTIWKMAGQPKKPRNLHAHNALADARWNAQVFNICADILKERGITL